MNIPTAEELYRDTKINSNLDLFSDDVPHLVKLMIEFAKLHVEAALEESKKKAEEIMSHSWEKEYEDSILNSYPLTNIK
jgi:FMN-dependent NADH-azoreductase